MTTNICKYWEGIQSKRLQRYNFNLCPQNPKLERKGPFFAFPRFSLRDQSHKMDLPFGELQEEKNCDFGDQKCEKGEDIWSPTTNWVDKFN